MHFPKNEIGAPFLGISCLLLSALAPVALAQVEDVQLDQGLTDERGASLGTCVGDATHLCFFDGRFSAAMVYQTEAGPVDATAVQPAGGKPGFFVFGDPHVAELWLDVLDACSINGFLWVTFLGVSDQGWTLRVDDHHSGQWKSFTVPTGSLGPPVTQTDSFPCPAVAEPRRPAQPLFGTAMDLGPGGRFRVTATLPTAVGEPNQLTRDAGLFSLFTPSSPNLLVKILYPALSPEWYGVVVSVNQNDVTVTVTDRCTGVAKSYTREATSYRDLDAFPADEAPCALFADGFEKGNTAGWDLTEP